MKKTILLPIAIILVFGFLLITLVSSCNLPSGTTSVFGDRIGLLYIDGVIMSGQPSDNPFYSTGVTSDRIVEVIKQAKDDTGIKAIVIRVNSPGGSAAASDEIYHAIMDFSDTGRPVIISMADVAASGGYYISAAADEIYANPATLTGSIGVIFQFLNYEGLFDKIGLNDETLTAGEFKDIGSPTRPMTDEERALLDTMLTEVHDQFKSAVMEGRGFTKEEIDGIATGMIFTGSQAYELGLVDELGGLQDAIARASELAKLGPNPVIDELGTTGFLDQLMEEMGAVNQPAGPLGAVADALNPLNSTTNPLYTMWGMILLDPRFAGDGAGIRF